MKVALYPHQEEALKKMHNGCILCGGVGSGKSRTALAYYNDNFSLSPFVIITTAKKRDTLDWEQECVPFQFKHKPIVDSWNNIKKYTDYENAFFIFDEQRVVGYGAWTKAFLKITKKNHWILLSATPGDCWLDYLPVFIANGYYKNKTDFIRLHVIYSRYTKYPSIDRYVNTGRLERLRREVLVTMKDSRETVQHQHDIYVNYDFKTYKWVEKYRQNPEDGKPCKNASAYCYQLRKIINSSHDRISKVMDILNDNERVIIFYNFDYELFMLRDMAVEQGTVVAEWNGHKHEECPKTHRWIYLVQYAAGAEGWNCISSNCMIFFSQTYSYRTLEQAKGRIDRMNTPYRDLHYYHLISNSRIDAAIRSALKKKQNFNVSGFIKS